MSRPKGSKNRSTIEKEAAVQTLLSAGLSIPRVADHLKLSRPTVTEIARKTKQTLEDEASGVLEDWRVASRTGALKGNHAPSRDWLLHAGIIKPLDSDKSQGPQVMIGIATLPGLPVSPTALTVSPTDFRPVIDAKSESET